MIRNMKENKIIIDGTEEVIWVDEDKVEILLKIIGIV